MGEKSKEWLKRFLYMTTPRELHPDGRPLYAYKMSERAYDEVMGEMKRLLEQARPGREDPLLGAVFCLYAAETFRREHIGGSWTYETVFAPLRMEEPDKARIRGWIESGLKWWRRPLLHGRYGDRLFLVTIACEGGLPLWLLKQEGAHLQVFFREVLDTYYHNGKGDEAQAIRVAKLHVQRLPLTLQQDTVFRLAGRLIHQIGELQPLVAQASDPIAALDEKEPNWRRDLPLRLEDEVADSLLRGLVHHSGELAREASVRLQWQGRLKDLGEGVWSIDKHLDLPGSLGERQIAGWLELTDANRPRWRVLLHGAHRAEPVAWLTRQGAGEQVRYHCELLLRRGIRLSGPAVMREHTLSLHDGVCDHALAVKNADPWGDSPWVFVERGQDGHLEWLTEGSVQTRAERVWVLATGELGVQVCSGSCDVVGSVPEVGRQVYRISGHVELTTPDGDRYRIQCRMPAESYSTFVVCGEALAEDLQQQPLYRGLPTIRMLDDNGRYQPAQRRLQWRPVGSSDSWRAAFENPCGRLQLRLVDDEGFERFRRRVDVLPREFALEFALGSPNQPGRVRLSGLGRAEVGLGSEAAQSVTIDAQGEQTEILCAGVQGALPNLDLRLFWPGSEPVSLSLPYPQRGASFRLEGRALPDEDLVALDRLAGMQLFAQDPVEHGRLRLNAELRANHVRSPQPDPDPDSEEVAEVRRTRPLQGFLETLPALENGRIEHSLFALQERVLSLLASTDDLDAQVRLSVETRTGERLSSVRICRFDVQLEPVHEVGCVRLSPEASERLGAGWQARVRLEMVRLWAPAQPPRALSATADDPGCWQLPADLEPGPWWIIGRDGDWGRFRPLLWSVQAPEPEEEGSAPVVESPLVCAIRQGDRNKRSQALHQVLDALGRDITHPDWKLLFEFIDLTREFPPSALDVVRRLVGHPRTLAQALFRAEESIFETVWALAERMPFLWVLIATTDWREAARTYFGGQRQALTRSASDPVVEMSPEWIDELVFGLFTSFRERVTNHSPRYWKVMCDWLQQDLFPGHELPASSELNLPVVVWQAVLEGEQASLQARHDADESWPQSREILALAEPSGERGNNMQAVLQAPQVAARISHEGTPVSEQLMYELRLLRFFDQEWFEFAYAIALTRCLAATTQESRGQE